MAAKNRIEIILGAVDKGLRTGFNRALVSLKSFVTGTGKAKSSIMGMDMSLSGLIARLGATVSVIAGLRKLVNISRGFDIISAGLETATGSAEKTETAFGAIQDFATNTPYDLGQVAEAFVKLVNYGLTPSEKALTSYGNTSAALGKDLSQMIEAVADAATGEFERLKEFGIKSRSEGDKVKFTFRGVTTEVGKNAKEIEDYLINLGEVNFGAAMANRMSKVDGLISNLGDEWDKVFLNISEKGLGDVIAESVGIAIGALQELNAMIASGELEAFLQATVGKFGMWAEDVKESVDIVRNYYDRSMRDVEEGGSSTVQFLVNAFRQWPENVRAFIGLLTVEIAAEFDVIVAKARLFKNTIKAVFTKETVEGAYRQFYIETAGIEAAKNESIDAILAERDATITAGAAAIAEAKKRRAVYDEERAAANANTEDRLSKYKIEADASGKAAEFTKKEISELKKLTEVKLRAAAQEKILALEKKKIAASILPSELERAEAELDIDRRIMAERIDLKREELAAIMADKDASQAEIIKAETDLAEALIRNEIALNEQLRNLEKIRMDETEKSWRRGIVSAEEYRAAVAAAFESGAIDAEEARERMILAGNDMSEALALGFQKGREKMQTDAEMMAYIGENLADTLAGGLTGAWGDFIDGSKSAKEAMADFGRSTLKWLIEIIAKQMILNAVKSVGSLFSGGGPVASYASGGRVSGYSPSPKADNIRAWLTAGEFVQPVKAVNHFGLPFMESIRRLKFPRHIALALAGGTLPRIPSGYRLAAGGVAAAGPTVKTGDVNLKMVNIVDRNMALDAMRSNEGETLLINMIRRNGSAIKAVLS